VPTHGRSAKMAPEAGSAPAPSRLTAGWTTRYPTLDFTNSSQGAPSFAAGPHPPPKSQCRALLLSCRAF